MLNELSQVLDNNAGMVLAVILSICGMATAILISVGTTLIIQWRCLRQTEDENSLKRELLHQGMSADDIEAIIVATARRSTADRFVHTAFRHFRGRCRKSHATAVGADRSHSHC